MTNEYQIFPDIRLVCGADGCWSDGDETEISVCIGGCCEYSTEHEYRYLTAGTCHIGRGDCRTVYSQNYRGITLLISPRESSSLGGLFDVQELCTCIGADEHLIFRADEAVQRLAEELSAVRGSSRTAMLRIRSVELLMLLGERKTARCEHGNTIGRIGSFICDNVSEHYTIPQLAELFGIAPHTLKAEFSRYYGSSVYAYTKLRKMFRAAELLRGTDMKIIDIAEEVGYCNASKFASAFRDVVGRAPRDYRTEHKLTASSAKCAVKAS